MPTKIANNFFIVWATDLKYTFWKSSKKKWKKTCKYYRVDSFFKVDIAETVKVDISLKIKKYP